MKTLAAYILGVPKAELHLHIEGTLEPELMMTLAKRNGITLPFASVEDIRAAYDFRDLQDFLDMYYRGAGVLMTEVDFYDLAMAYFQKAGSQGVRHAELFFDPQTHTERGISFETVVEGLWRACKEAKERLGMTSRLIMCFLRHLDAASAMATLQEAMPYKDRIVAVGLDSSENGNSPSKFAEVFTRARAEGFRAVAHAGEEGPASYVRDAIDLLKVERVDHGNRALEDPALVAELVAHRIPLTVCPLSNLKLRVVKDLAAHPLRRMLDAGLLVTVNSDDPAYFGGYVAENYAAIAESLELSQNDITRLAANSFAASFLEDAEKKRLIVEVNAY